MRIEQILSEAARFTSKEFNEVMNYANQFNVGIEYEFHASDEHLSLDLEQARERHYEFFESEFAEDILSRRDFMDMVNEAGQLIETYEGEGEEEVEEAIRNFSNDNPSETDARVLNEFKQDMEDREDLIIRIDDFNDIFTIYQEELPRIITLPNISEAYRYIVAGELPDISKDISSSVLEKIETLYDFYRTDLKRIADLDEDQYEYLGSRYVENKLKQVDERRPVDDLIEELKPEVQGLLGQHYEDLYEDPSVQDGLEMTTDAYSTDLEEAINLNHKIFDWLRDNNFTTSDQTGLHVNVSLRNYDPEDMNPCKLVTLLDPSVNIGRSEYLRYPERSTYAQDLYRSMKDPQVIKIYQDEDTGKEYYFIENETDPIHSTNVLTKLGRAYIESGFDGVESIFEEFIRKYASKITSMYFGAFFASRKYKHDFDRIEFRYLGGDYLNDDISEINKDIAKICHNMLYATSDKFLEEEYMKNLMRILSREIKLRTFDLVDINGIPIREEQFSDINDLVSFLRRLPKVS